MRYVFVIFMFTAYGIINYYLGRVSWEYLFKYIPYLNNKVFWVLFWLVAWSYVLFRLFDKYLPYTINVLLTWISGYWIAVFFYLCLILPVIFLIKFLNKYLNLLPASLQNPQAVTVGVIIFIGMLLLYGTWNARVAPIKTLHYDVVINKEVDGLSELNIVLVADMHLDHVNNNKRLERVVDKINENQPDLVLLAGDNIDTGISFYKEQQMDKTLQKIQSKYGVYGVLGNHEYYEGDISEIMAALERGSVKMLRDEYVLVNDSFYVVGRDDLTVSMTGRKRGKLSTVMEGIDKELPIILLDHQPLNLDESLENGVDLQLSGHTHRGQFFPNHLVTRRIFEVDWGYLKKDSLQVIVSSGVNTWGPPLRINSRPEIKSIKVMFAKELE